MMHIYIVNAGGLRVVVYLAEPSLAQGKKHEAPSEEKLSNNGLLAELANHYTMQVSM